MKNKIIRFKINEGEFYEFKILCVKNKITMTDVLKDAVKKAIDLGIYVDMTDKKEQINND